MESREKVIDSIIQAHSLLMEKEFLRKVYYWSRDYETVDAIYYFVGCFAKMDKKELNPWDVNKHFCSTFFKKYLDVSSGGIKLAEFTVPTLYSTFCAFGGIADMLGLCDEKKNNVLGGDGRQKKIVPWYPIHYKKHANKFKALGVSEHKWGNIKDGVRKFLNRSFSTDKETGFSVFKESPWSNQPATSVVNSTALRLLTILGLFDEKDFKEKIPLVADFLLHCIARNKTKGFSGFSSLPGGEIMLCPTFFTSKTFFSEHYVTLLETYPGLQKVKNEILSEVEGIEKLIVECWNPEVGGFRIVPDKREDPTVVHTKHAMKLYQTVINQKKGWFKEFSGLFKYSTREMGLKIATFLEQCRVPKKDSIANGFSDDDENAGYGFALGFTQNLFATRNAVDIYCTLKDEGALDSSMVNEVFQTISDYICKAFYKEGIGITAFPHT